MVFIEILAFFVVVAEVRKGKGENLTHTGHGSLNPGPLQNTQKSWTNPTNTPWWILNYSPIDSIGYILKQSTLVFKFRKLYKTFEQLPNKTKVRE